MPTPLPLTVRDQIALLHQTDLSAAQIAQQLSLQPRTVRRLLARWQQAPNPLDHSPRPHGGGRPLEPDRLPLRQACLQLRQDHPGWGAGRIRVELLQLHPGLPVPPRAHCNAGCTRPG
jgi:Homeodomain-like domain